MADSPLQATGEVTPAKTIQEIVKEAKRLEESTLYSSKGHFAAAEFWSKFHLGIGIPNATLAGIAGALALSTFATSLWVRTIAGILSIVAGGLAALQTFLNPNEKAAVHLGSGNNYDALNGAARIFWTVDCWSGLSEQVLTERLKDLANQKEKLNRACPQIPGWAYARAKKGIEAGEGVYSVDKIDAPSAKQLPPSPANEQAVGNDLKES
jgi:hypothetical protein